MVEYDVIVNELNEKICEIFGDDYQDVFSTRTTTFWDSIFFNDVCLWDSENSTQKEKENETYETVEECVKREFVEYVERLNRIKEAL